MNDLKIIKIEGGGDLFVYKSFTFYQEKHVNYGLKLCYTHRGCLFKVYLNVLQLFFDLN
jgi:hypothetical protein